MKQSQTLGEEQHSVSFIERAANENQSKFFRQVEDEGDVEVDAVVNNRQSILDADLRAPRARAPLCDFMEMWTRLEPFCSFLDAL